MKKRCVFWVSPERQERVETNLSEKGWSWLALDLENTEWEQSEAEIEDYSPHVGLFEYSEIFSPALFLKKISQIRRLSNHDLPIILLYPPSLTAKAYEDNLEEFEEVSYLSIQNNLSDRRLLSYLDKAFRAFQTSTRLQQYTRSIDEEYSVQQFIGNSAKAENVREFIRLIKDVAVTSLLITGETGTGKSIVARIIHHNGVRKEGPLIELNCAAIPSNMLESEMFGHEAGSFTGAVKRHIGVLERADGGTLFLDEIGDMDFDLQAKLLKAIEDQKFTRIGGEKEISIDVQIIAATHQDIETGISENSFREDLYHRLSVFSLVLPSLRERKKDLLELVPHLIAYFNTRSNKSVKVISDQIWEALFDHDWPGNIRELSNVIERCVLLSNDETLPFEWLQIGEIAQNNTQISSRQQENADAVTIPTDGSLNFDDIQKKVIEAFLAKFDNNISQAARCLGMSREKLRYRIRKYNIYTR